jgi:hypothetical protein
VLTTRLYLVLATPEITPRSIVRTGVHERVRGLHPSDHAGLVATLAIP